MKVGCPLETAEGEKRVAMTPDSVGQIRKLGYECLVQSGSGAAAGFDDRFIYDRIRGTAQRASARAPSHSRSVFFYNNTMVPSLRNMSSLRSRRTKASVCVMF